MFEIEQMEQQFDYSLVDNDTADFLRSCEYEINGIAEDARVKFGKVLIKAREKLANHHGGVFQKWYESGGLDRNNVYYYMDLYESSRNLENSQRENFLKAPKTVQKKTMQKNTPEEVKEAVYSGEVKTNKELEELKKRLKNQSETIDETTSQLKAREKENEILQSKLEQAENKAPEIVERYTEPEDYEELKENIRRMKRQEKSLGENNKRLMEEISDMRNERSDMDTKSKKYEELTQAINEMNGRLTEGQLRIKNQKLVYDLVKKSEALISEVAPLTYSISHLGVDDNKYAKEPLIKIAENLEDISSRIRKQLNENKIIEVE